MWRHWNTSQPFFSAVIAAKGSQRVCTLLYKLCKSQNKLTAKPLWLLDREPMLRYYSLHSRKFPSVMTYVPNHWFVSFHNPCPSFTWAIGVPKCEPFKAYESCFPSTKHEMEPMITTYDPLDPVPKVLQVVFVTFKWRSFNSSEVSGPGRGGSWMPPLEVKVDCLSMISMGGEDVPMMKDNWWSCVLNNFWTKKFNPILLYIHKPLMAFHCMYWKSAN